MSSQTSRPYKELAEEVLRDAIVVLGHTDIAASDVDWRRESGERHVMDRRHYPTLSSGGVRAVCDHVGGDWRYGYIPATRLHTDSLQRYMRVLDHTYAELAESDHFVLATTTADIVKAKRENKIAFIICLEGASPLQNEISYLRNFYKLGLRCVGLTHDVRNEVADGIRERNGGGLTHFGVTVVKECASLGIVVDVSHLSDRGTEDVLEVSTQPIIASHSNSRALCSNLRNLPDHMIRGIAQSGGVIGFHALDRFVSDSPNSTLDHVLKHIAYVAELGGVDCVGIGPDIMENWDPHIVDYVTERSSTINGIPIGHWKHGYPEGMKSNADLPRLTEGLLSIGFNTADVKKILGGNFIRVFDAVWKPEVAAEPGSRLK